jgi:Family of unknown function (DUF6049)
MRKLLSVFLTLFFLSAPLPFASADDVVVRITSTLHQNFTGEFRNDDLAQELTPSGRLGQLVFTPLSTSKIWVIDPALIDEVIAMSGEYKLATDAAPAGKDIAIAWLAQLKKNTAANDVVALPYGNPDIAMAKRLAPGELKIYYSYGKMVLEIALGRVVRSEATGGWSKGSSKISPLLRKSFSEDRKNLTRLSKVVNVPDVVQLRMRLGRLLSPALDAESRAYFSFNAKTAVDAQLHRLRVNPGKYQLTTEKAALPVTVINEFPIDITVDIQMLAMNTRIVVDSFTGVKLTANSKRQLELNAFVIAPGQTIVFAQITDGQGTDVVPAASLALNATVIDPRLTWFTTGTAILLLLAAIVQSVRRVRKGRQSEI